MRKKFNYNIIEAIIGMDFEKAKEICQFNGYLLTNNQIDNSFDVISYELENNKVVKAYFNKK